MTDWECATGHIPFLIPSVPIFTHPIMKRKGNDLKGVIMLGIIIEVFMDIVWTCACIVLCCWLLKFIFGIIRGTARSVKDTFVWTKNKVEQPKNDKDCTYNC